MYTYIFDICKCQVKWLVFRIYLISIYLKVKYRVRKISGKLKERTPTVYVTQIPVVTNTLTGRRKIYLFPLFYGEW